MNRPHAHAKHLVLFPPSGEPLVDIAFPLLISLFFPSLFLFSLMEINDRTWFEQLKGIKSQGYLDFLEVISQGYLPYCYQAINHQALMFTSSRPFS